MKRIILIILFSVVLGCSEGQMYTTGPEEQELDCAVIFGGMDWPDIYERLSTGGIEELNDFEKEVFSNRMNTQFNDPQRLAVLKGECARNETGCAVINCIMKDAIDKQDASVCDQLPVKTSSKINTCSNITERIQLFFGLSPEDYDEAMCSGGQYGFVYVRGEEYSASFKNYHISGADTCIETANPELLQHVKETVCAYNNRSCSRSQEDFYEQCMGQTYSTEQNGFTRFAVSTHPEYCEYIDDPCRVEEPRNHTPRIMCNAFVKYRELTQV